MCHHWEVHGETLREMIEEAEDEDEPGFAEADLSEPDIGETEIEEPEIDEPEIPEPADD